MRDSTAAGAALAALLVSGLLTGAALSATGSGLGVRTEATVTVGSSSPTVTVGGGGSPRRAHHAIRPRQ
ncbi:hypothetical protein ABT065_12795 [Streptomyces sp. NPDC002764]|uniref:hypothetical protein n=1 Tax=Streptomyces sp. NPDC002764 TaxID=3154428 RepID=UPI0033190654